ncbi:MAG: carboxyl transferase [Lachnospiraceae bacterium]|nr:carboxyl transferase [Lachnospiraceae bacterium]
MSNANALSAKARISALTDENSFVEIGALVTKRSTDFNMDEKEVPCDGVVTGYALIHDKPVYIYSQDADKMNGSIGEMHAKKIVNVIELAVKTGTPVVGLIDCSGIRVQESVDALHAFGLIYKALTEADGEVPVISAVLGNGGGGVKIMTELSDFTFVEKNNGKLFVNTPNSIDNNYKEKCDTSSACFAGETGAVDFVCDGEAELFEKVRELVSILPLNCNDIGEIEDYMDDLNRDVPDFAAKVADPALALEEIGDNNFFMEVKADYAKEMVTGFICLDGLTIGAIGNRTVRYDEEGNEAEKFEPRLTTKGARKAAQFVNFCDSFNIPILTLTNVCGYKATMCEEKNISRAVAELTYALSAATVAKVNLITGEAYGTAAITMNSKAIGADMVFALPTAKFGVMDSDKAVKIMYPDADQDEIKAQKDKYKKATDITAAAARGYVDSIIEPASVRKQVLFAFEMLYTKSV